MNEFEFLRVGAATPDLRVADCRFNASRIIEMMRHANVEGVDLLVFPELCLTGYSCADLFHQSTLLQAALSALQVVVEASRSEFAGLLAVGVPLVLNDRLFNCACVLQNGSILGVVPKTFLPNYKEFYEERWFASANQAQSRTIRLGDRDIPFGNDLLFKAEGIDNFVIGVEICEDLWVPIPPSSRQSLAGATVLINLSASNETIGKSEYRRQLVIGQSGRCIAGYVYASCGVQESTTDLVFGGHCLIAENGTLLAESQRFQRSVSLTVADLDIQRLIGDRIRTNSFGAERIVDPSVHQFRLQKWNLPPRVAPISLKRFIDPHPFVPRGHSELRERCEEIFNIQVAGLAKRLEHIGIPPLAIGVSGGLDSTLALLVCCRTLDRLGVNRDRIQAITMPGFGTTKRTKSNALQLMEGLGVSFREVDIRSMCVEEMRALAYAPFGIHLDGLTLSEITEQLSRVPLGNRNDLVFENIQARKRTTLLMNSGFVIGTGDVSELALGWCTYNADHMSMYNPNVSIPKTLVKFLVEWAARNEFTDEVQTTLLDIVGTEISPELLPTGPDGQNVQSTEATIGPYELHDFFLYHFLRYGASPRKILFLASQTRFDKPYDPGELRKWLKLFLKRFFANQYKRSCLPDGPKVGSISLSPRGDWRMPSDAMVANWISSLEESPT